MTLAARLADDAIKIRTDAVRSALLKGDRTAETTTEMPPDR